MCDFDKLLSSSVVGFWVWASVTIDNFMSLLLEKEEITKIVEMNIAAAFSGDR